MGVKVKLADNREVGAQSYKAGDVVDVDPGDARLLVAVGAGVKVDDGNAVATAATAPEATVGNTTIPKDQPTVGDSVPAPAVGDSSKLGAARQKG